ncbi:MAG: DUF4190 domain-containing protein [Verrucomicrobiae bacterium]|nr:DUF4190 domain-containing protein [Verrucomicrobiae bacterium]
MSTPAPPTFKIIGGDGNEYGPIDAATLQQWAREGRLVRQSKVWDSRANAWVSAGDVAELAAVFGAPATPSPSPPAIPAPLTAPHAARRTNPLAIWSLVLSLLGLCCGITPIAGIICGVIALPQIKASGEEGRGMAIAGIVIGVVLLALSLLGLLLWMMLVLAAAPNVIVCQ